MVIQTNTNYNKKNSTLIPMKLDIIMLTNLCRYVLQNNSLVRMEHLVNLRKMMYALDPKTYENEPDKQQRVRFIFKALEARLDNNIVDRNIILTYINGGLTFKVDFLDYDNIDLSRNDVIFLHKLVSETLQYQFMYYRCQQFADLSTRFLSTDFQTRGGIVSEFNTLLKETTNDFRRVEVADNSIDMTFSLAEGRFENCVTDTWNMVTNPSRRLLTGMQGINQMTGGGFESGRTYMLLGTSGVGKSLTLLNLIYQIKRANANYKTKDPTKRPCIVLLTMENTVTETITRLFDLACEGAHGMANYSCSEVIDMLRTQGELQLTDSSPIDIVIKYKANKSVDTSYLYTLCDDLDDEGYEVICLVQDHVKRIRSIYANTDLRLELGDVVNELKVFAAQKDIPVITNSHLNRDAARTLEEAARKGGQDAGKLLGKSNIGESMLMIDNLDCAMIIALDFDKDENKYMTFNLIKMRDKTNRTYIAQPFVRGNSIRLVEDLGAIPQFKESIHVAPEVKRNGCVKVSGASSLVNVNSIGEVIDINEDDIKDNAFAKQSYNLNPNAQSMNQITPTVVKPMVFINDANSMSDGLADLRSLYGIQNQTPVVQNNNGIICPILFEGDNGYENAV